MIFECVLAYMTPAASSAVVNWFTDYFAAPGGTAPLGCVVYEMFALHGPFGKVMVNNLKVRLSLVRPRIRACQAKLTHTRHGMSPYLGQSRTQHLSRCPRGFYSMGGSSREQSR